MAIIGRIRNRMGVLAAGVIGFALVLFIVTDLLTSNRSFLGGNDTSIGIVGGEKINPQDFDDKVKETEENIKLQQNKTDLTTQESDQARDQAWNQMTNDIIYNKQYGKLGINVTDDELFDMVQGKFVHPQLKQYFTDKQTGQFNPQAVIQYLKQLETNSDEARKAKAQWLNFEDGMQDERLRSKYDDLIQGGIYITNEEAKQDFNDKNTNYSIKYLVLNYNTISDSSVQVSEDDLKTAYNNSLYKYKQTETVRKADFITFDVNASAEDRKSAQEYINKLIEPFKTSTDDTTFVNLNSDVKYTDQWLKKGTMRPDQDSMFFAMAKGDVMGPYEEANAFKLAKIIDHRYFPDSVNVRHILCGYRDPKQVTQAEKDSLKMKADTLLKYLKAGADFASLAAQFTTDQGSKDKGGDYGWQTPEVNFVPEFKEAMFNGKIKEFQLVETAFGFHIIQTTDVAKTGSVRIKVGYLVRNIEPGGKTYEMMYAKANEFSGKNNTKALFDKACKDQNFRIQNADNLRESDKFIPGLGTNVREIVRWVYSAQKDQVSNAFKVDNKYVVVVLKDILEKGYQPLESVKEQVTADAKRDKKAKTLIDKVNAAGTQSSIDALAAKLQTAAVQADNVNFGNSYVQNLGNEPSVVGGLAALKQGQMSKAIKGTTGVIVVQVLAINKPAATKDFTEAKKQLMQSTKQRAQYEVYNALKEKANIVDNRGKYF